MSDKEVIIGNLTTIIMFIFSTCGGAGIINSLGGTSQTAILVGAVLGLIFSFINAYYPNFFGFLNNNKNAIESVANSINQCDCDCSGDGEE